MHDNFGEYKSLYTPLGTPLSVRAIVNEPFDRIPSIRRCIDDRNAVSHSVYTRRWTALSSAHVDCPSPRKLLRYGDTHSVSRDARLL